STWANLAKAPKWCSRVNTSLLRREHPRTIPVRPGRVSFQEFAAFDIQPTWRGGTPREHFFEFLACGELSYGLVPALLPIECKPLVIQRAHLDLLRGQLALRCHDLDRLYGF